MPALAESRRFISRIGETFTHRQAKLDRSQRILNGGITQKDRDTLRGKIMASTALANIPMIEPLEGFSPNSMEDIRNTSEGISDERLDTMLKENAAKILSKRKHAPSSA